MLLSFRFQFLPSLVLWLILMLGACSVNTRSGLDLWLASRQLPGTELIDKVEQEENYFALFRSGEKILLMQRIAVNESIIGGYSSSLGVDDIEGVFTDVVDQKTKIDSAHFYRQDDKQYKERTILLTIKPEYEGKLHIVYRWRPVTLGAIKTDVGADGTRVDPLVIDVETFWVSSAT